MRRLPFKIKALTMQPFSSFISDRRGNGLSCFISSLERKFSDMSTFNGSGQIYNCLRMCNETFFEAMTHTSEYPKEQLHTNLQVKSHAVMIQFNQVLTIF